MTAGRVHCRPDAGTPDRLELTSDVLEPRIAVALVVLMVGREP